MTTQARWLLVLGLTACSHVVDTEPPPPDLPAPRKERRTPGTAPTGDPARAGAEHTVPRAPAPRPASEAEHARYAFLPASAQIRPLVDAVEPPRGYRRVDLDERSFGAFLRGLPLRDADAPVRAYDGSLLHEASDGRVFAVAELDVSPLDVQQCADSVIRLHAEWLWSGGDKQKIGYHFLSGDYATYTRYAAGERPQVDGNRVRWATSAAPADDRKTFRRYLDMVFNYASTISLAQRTAKIQKAELGPGDFFVLPGGPGHAILILDVATTEDGRRAALLGQGFMPAQDFHVLESGERDISPWFSLDGEAVDTPFWPEAFPWTSLRRFRD